MWKVSSVPAPSFGLSTAGYEASAGKPSEGFTRRQGGVSIPRAARWTPSRDLSPAIATASGEEPRRRAPASPSRRVSSSRRPVVSGAMRTVKSASSARDDHAPRMVARSDSRGDPGAGVVVEPGVERHDDARAAVVGRGEVGRDRPAHCAALVGPRGRQFVTSQSAAGNPFVDQDRSAESRGDHARELSCHTRHRREGGQGGPCRRRPPRSVSNASQHLASECRPSRAGRRPAKRAWARSPLSRRPGCDRGRGRSTAASTSASSPRGSSSGSTPASETLDHAKSWPGIDPDRCRLVVGLESVAGPEGLAGHPGPRRRGPGDLQSGPGRRTAPDRPGRRAGQGPGPTRSWQGPSIAASRGSSCSTWSGSGPDAGSERQPAGADSGSPSPG